MISIRPIPLDLRPDRIVGREGPDPEAFEAFIRENAHQVDPSACFTELESACIGLKEGTGNIWGKTLIAGVCGLGPNSGGEAFRDEAERVAWRLLCEIALSDCLDLVEYRVRQYLKPTGRKPGVRLIPGCKELPLDFNRTILDQLEPNCAEGLQVSSSGELTGAFGVVFVYPGADLPGSVEERCAHCAQKQCPSRAGLVLGRTGLKG